MKHLFFLALFCVLFTGCIEYEDVDFKGVENVDMGKIEGKIVNLSVDVRLDNPNFFGIAIKPSSVDVYAEDELLGTTFLKNKIKLTKKKEDVYTFPLQIKLADGGLFKIMKYALKNKVKLHVVGKVKGAVYGITKRIKIDEYKEVEGRKLKFLQNQ